MQLLQWMTSKISCAFCADKQCHFLFIMSLMERTSYYFMRLYSQEKRQHLSFVQKPDVTFVYVKGRLVAM